LDLIAVITKHASSTIHIVMLNIELL